MFVVAVVVLFLLMILYCTVLYCVVWLMIQCCIVLSCVRKDALSYLVLRCTANCVDSCCVVSKASFSAIILSLGKNGLCPFVTGSCDQGCTNDTGCNAKQKCCFSGCGFQCKDPVETCE